MLNKLLNIFKRGASTLVELPQDTVCCANCLAPGKGYRKPRISFYPTAPNAAPVVLTVGRAYCSKCEDSQVISGFINDDVLRSVAHAFEQRGLVSLDTPTARLEWVSF